MNTICVSSLKGGTAKSTTCHALGVALAGEGLKVLMVDMDPQSSLSFSCGVKNAEGRSMTEVLGTAHPGELGVSEIFRDLGGGLQLAPADLSLAACELGLVSRLGRELVLRKALESISSQFDLCIIDTHPGLSLLTIASLTAADVVIVPTSPAIIDIHSLALFRKSLEQVQDNLNPKIKILGILVTGYDARLKHHQQALEFIRSSGLPMFETMIGRSVKVAEAGGHGQTILTYEPDNKQAENYRQFAKEVLQWHQRN